MNQCCCLTEDGDYIFSLFSEKLVIGKKEYKCYECLRPIKIGERHLYSTGKNPDNKWECFRTCLGCARMIDEYSRGGRVFGTLSEDIMECFGTNIVFGEEITDEEEDG